MVISPLGGFGRSYIEPIYRLTPARVSQAAAVAIAYAAEHPERLERLLLHGG
jgi:hypothetical protein